MLNRNSVAYQWIVGNCEALRNVSPSANHEFEFGRQLADAAIPKHGIAERERML